MARSAPHPLALSLSLNKLSATRIEWGNRLRHSFYFLSYSRFQCPLSREDKEIASCRGIMALTTLLRQGRSRAKTRRSFRRSANQISCALLPCNKHVKFQMSTAPGTAIVVTIVFCLVLQLTSSHYPGSS
jgi:hypothetical protein